MGYSGAAKTVNWCYPQIDEKGDLKIDPSLSELQIELEKNQSWIDLPEWHRLSNRRSVDFFLVKLRALGYKIVKAQGEKSQLVVDAALWDRIGRMEHDSWNAFHEMAGWQHGDKCLAKKTHPSLIPFETLDVKELRKDKMITQAMIKYAQDKPMEFSFY